MTDIYMLSDTDICSKMAQRIKSLRLKQNMSQKQLAHDADVSLSSVIRIEEGNIGSFDTLIRVLRILGKLDILSSLIEDEPISPMEYFNLIHSQNTSPVRHRAAKSKPKVIEEDQSW